MKNIVVLIGLLLTFGLAKAQSNREDLEINWPKGEERELDEKLSSTQTDFSRRRQKWNLKGGAKEKWQEMVTILSEDITKNTISFDSINAFFDPSKTKGAIIKFLKEKKDGPFPYKLISIESENIKSKQIPTSTLVYIIDGKTCRHTVFVSMITSRFPADFLKQWSEVLLNSKVIPSKAGNFEYTDDAVFDVKEINGSKTFLVKANFRSVQEQHLLKGQSVKVVLDDLPETSLSGKILEIGGLKNNSALISPNTATGKFVKMIERFPVVISVEIPSATEDKFKTGMSCTVKVATAP